MVTRSNACWSACRLDGPPPADEIESAVPQVEALIKATGIDFRIGGNRAFYMPSHDYVQMPPPAAYFEPINWHRTALHELGHASGHCSRLDRDLSGSFGSKKYAFEELIAELCSAFSCVSLSIEPTVRHADYIGSWLEVLCEDIRCFAARQGTVVSPACSGDGAVVDMAYYCAVSLRRYRQRVNLGASFGFETMIAGIAAPMQCNPITTRKHSMLGGK